MSYEHCFTASFEGDESPELISTHYLSPSIGRELKSIRGRVILSRSGTGTFQWTSAVIALSVALLRAKYVRFTNAVNSDWVELAGLRGRTGSLALSLDFALSKEPIWLKEMFGVDSNGNTLGRRVFTRLNSEGKRVGPTTVVLNRSFLDPSNISITWNGTELLDSESVFTLLSKISPSQAEEITPNKKDPPPTKPVATHQPIPVLIPCSMSPGGLYRYIQTTEDLLVQFLSHVNTIEQSKLLESMRDQFGVIVSEESLSEGVSRLRKRGIIRSRGDQLSLSAYWQQTRYHLIEEIADYARNGNQGISLATGSATKLSATIHFRTISDYYNLMPRFITETLQEFTPSLNVTEWLFQPWLRTDGSFEKEDGFTLVRSKGSIVYLGFGNRSMEAWTQSLYTESIDEGMHHDGDSCLAEMWIHEDLVVCQLLSPELWRARDRLRDLARQSELEVIQSRLAALSGSIMVQVTVAPGLSAMLGAMLSRALISPPEGMPLGNASFTESE